MSGSPRIWGDAWVWERVLIICSGSRRLAGNRYVAGAVVVGAIVVVISIVIALVMTGEDNTAEVASGVKPTPTRGPDYLTELDALPLAVDVLKTHGFAGNSFSHIARRVPFRDYASAIGEAFQADEGNLEIPPQREVWVFGFKGEIVLDVSDGTSVPYDNLTVVLDALSGDVIRAEAFYGDFESPLRAPVWLSVPTPTQER